MHNKIWAITETSPQHGRPQPTQLLLNRFPANWIYDQIKINRKSQHTWHVHLMTSLTLGVSRVTGKNLKLKLSVRITPWKISSPFSHDSPDFPSPFFFFEVMTWLKWIWRPLIQTSLIIRNGNYRPFSDLRSTLFVISRLQPESIEWAANKAAVLPNSFSPRLCFSPLCWSLCSSKMVGICLAESLENLSHLCIVRAGNNIDRNFIYRNSPLFIWCLILNHNSYISGGIIGWPDEPICQSNQSCGLSPSDCCSAFYWNILYGLVLCVSF